MGERLTDLTEDLKDKFIQILEDAGNVSQASRAINFSRQWMYEVKKEDKEFRERWENAINVATDRLEREAWRRAVDGYEEPVVYQGQFSYIPDPEDPKNKFLTDGEGKPRIVTVRKFSDQLISLLLKGHRPDKYRERTEITGKDGGPIETKSLDFENMTAAEKAIMSSMVIKAQAPQVETNGGGAHADN